MTIAPILKIEREKMGTMGILMLIDDVVYVCIRRFYSDVYRKYTSHLSYTNQYFFTFYIMVKTLWQIYKYWWQTNIYLWWWEWCFFQNRRIKRPIMQNIRRHIEIDIMLFWHQMWNMQEYVGSVQGENKKPQVLCIFKVHHIVILKDYHRSDHVLMMQ